MEHDKECRCDECVVKDTAAIHEAQEAEMRRDLEKNPPE
jgi:hypothetical protein